jgi:hypothetical protein
LYEDELLGFVGQQLLPLYGILHQVGEDTMPYRTLEVPYFTEYERNGVVYRAHPQYRGEYQYYDWAYIRWNLGEDRRTGDETFQSVIGRLLGFFRHPDGFLMAIVHSCEVGTDEQHGVFGTCWHLEYNNQANPRPRLSMVNVDCIEDHACMIPYSEENPLAWVHVWHPHEWPGCFQTIDPPEEDSIRLG